MEYTDENIKRRKLDDSTKIKETGICIIHAKHIKCGEFTFIRNTKNPNERFQKILSVKEKRLMEPLGSPYRMSEICAQIPGICKDDYGYHKACYARFTGNLLRLISTDQPSSSKPRESRQSSSIGSTTFNPDCIFCRKSGRKAVKIKGVWTTEDTTFFECGGSESVQKAAEKKEDFELLGRIASSDLFACKAKYHPRCRKNYLKDPERGKSHNIESTEEQEALERAHQYAFECVCEFITENIIVRQNVVNLTTLRQMYCSYLDETPYSNTEYRSCKLKTKIEKHLEFQGVIGFCPIKDGHSSFLVFNTKMDIQKAMESSYKLGQKEKIMESAELLRNDVVNSFSEVDEMTWPITVKDLDYTSILPTTLEKFLSNLLSGKKDPSSSTCRLVNSIGQDICRAVTCGKWRLPKHITIGMALRHMFRSADLITILNRLGHCENYSFLLELETALATSVDNTQSIVPPNIIRNPTSPAVFHSDFDNFDAYVNELYGAGSVHRAHGIMMQDLVQGAYENTDRTDPVLEIQPRTGDRSMKSIIEPALPDCYLGKRKSPQIQITTKVIEGGREVLENQMRKNLLYIIVRMQSVKRNSRQTIPAWGGYVSVTGDVPEKLTTIEYYPVIPHPITDIRTVQECLRCSEEASKEVGQKYVITTFDLGVCMMAYPLVWSNSKRYEDHIIMIGTFHLACGYLKMLGKKMEGTGFPEILLEASLITPGSLSGVISAKNYSRSLNCHKVLMEALERLMLSVFLDKKGENALLEKLPESSKNLVNNLVKYPSKDAEKAILNDQDVCSYLEEYMKFREDIRNGHFGKTAALWMSYIDHVWLTLSLLQAVKTNNFTVYAQCISIMPELFFSFGGQNYARYLTYFSLFIANIEESHPGALDLLRRGAISVARSFVPGSRCAVDKTIEETFMKHSKSKGGSGSKGAGLSGLQTSYSACQRWTKSAKERAKYNQALLQFAGISDGGQSSLKHHDVRPSEIERTEKYVTKASEAFNCFNNPFQMPDDGKLYNISSGAPASDDVARDVLTAEVTGRKAKEDFIDSRLMKNEGFFNPIKRLNLKTLAHMHQTVKLSTSNNKLIEYKQQGNIAFQLLMKSRDKKLDLEKLMTYPLTPVPFSIGLADGFLAKTDKSKGFRYIVKDCDDAKLPQSEEAVVIEDGNAIFHMLREIPPTFGEISQKILSSLPLQSTVVFSTDMYKNNSVKSVERVRRGVSDKLIVSGVKTKRPKDWKQFLTNDDNKVQLVRLLLADWSSNTSAKILFGHEVIIICDGKAYQLTSDGKSTKCKEIDFLYSTQEETDSRVVLYTMYAKNRGFKFARVRSPDSDIFFILLHYAASLEGINILFETGRGNNRRCIDVTTLATSLSSEYCTALLGLHAFTGCDTTSAFKGKGKVKALKIMQNDARFQNAFQLLGEAWKLEKETVDEIDRFACVLYGNKKIKEVNNLRFATLQARCGGDEISKEVKHYDLATLPPCRSVLEQHVFRCNFQTRIWKLAHVPEPDVPRPTDGHGWLEENDIMKPKWTDGNIMPKNLVDILQDIVDANDSESDCDSEQEFFSESDDESE